MIPDGLLASVQTCHRRAHYSHDAAEYNDWLADSPRLLNQFPSNLALACC
jgi:hypothetical protein